jgi:methyl-accepting chemotaxis protein
MILHRLKLPAKLGLLLMLSTLAAVAIGVIGAATLHRRMLDDRVDKIRSVVDSTVAIARGLDGRISKHELTQAEAIEAFHGDIRAIRYDHGDGYISVADTRTGNVLMHGVNPALEGKPTPADTATGRPISDLLLEAVRDSDEAITGYMFPKPGQTLPLRKLVSVAKFAPWNIVIYAGAYTDDLEAVFRDSLVWIVAVGGAILLTTALIAWLVSRDITHSLGGLKSTMGRLADGDLEVTVPDTARGDEVGEMASALLVFQQRMVQGRALAAEHENDRLRAAAEKTAAMNRMADGFETGVGEILTAVVSSATDMKTTARGMSETATQTSEQSAIVAAAAQEADAGMQTVAAASEELASSISEITRQVSHAATISERAVQDAQRTDTIVRALADGAHKIGDVVTLITGIAGQTNLLALNATIEAARAGEAGKGFAVVASEVKDLAGQTAKATHEIAGQVAAIRSSTEQAVAAIQAITATIAEIRSISTAIASAVEQQGGATGEIARNVQQTAASAQDIAANIGGVSQAADSTGIAANKVFGAASDLSSRADQLAGQVNRFLTDMRAA